MNFPELLKLSSNGNECKPLHLRRPACSAGTACISPTAYQQARPWLFIGRGILFESSLRGRVMTVCGIEIAPTVSDAGRPTVRCRFGVV